MSRARFLHIFVKYKFVCKELNETGVDEDASAEGVEDAADDARGRAVGVVRRADAEAGGDA